VTVWRLGLAILIALSSAVTPTLRAAVQISGTAAIDVPPTEATLGFKIFPNAVYLTSYDAGHGQRYYLFGTNAVYSDLVQYYSKILNERGNRVFNAPPTHIFRIGRFREQSMAFPPGVTIKDYTWNRSAGYLNPTLGASPERFRTVIQIVPAPPGER